jgi:hypothetical protein
MLSLMKVSENRWITYRSSSSHSILIPQSVPFTPKYEACFWYYIFSKNFLIPWNAELDCKMPIQVCPPMNSWFGLLWWTSRRNAFSPPVEWVLGCTVTDTLSELLWPTVSVTVNWKVYAPSCRWDSFRVPGWGTWSQTEQVTFSEDSWT